MLWKLGNVLSRWWFISEILLKLIEGLNVGPNQLSLTEVMFV